MVTHTGESTPKRRLAREVKPGEIHRHIHVRQLFKMLDFAGGPGGVAYAIGGPHIDGGFYLFDDLVTKVMVRDRNAVRLEERFREMVSAYSHSIALRKQGMMN